MNTFELNSLDKLSLAAQWVLDNIKGKKVVAFYGEMGAGKTTLIKEICNILGCKANITSPTFAIVNEYPLSEIESVFHFDFYRIQKFQELLDIGFEEYLFSGNLCFIEWPEISESILPENTLKISIKALNESNRILTVIV
jgi:tRNA threonylcarbamoyladenosine biosynthesis protein TsaE